MNTQHDHGTPVDLAEQAAGRTIIPAFHGHARAEKSEPHDHAHDDHADDDHDHPFEWPEMLRIGLVAAAAGCVWWRVWEPFTTFSIIGVTGLLAGGWPIFKEALENLAAKRMTMELSMSIAIVAAAAISEFFT